MSKTINEIAKELGMSSEEISEKANFMGIEVFNGSIEDIDAVALKNTVLHSKKKTETKIVKVEPKKTEKKAEEKEEVKISVKQANVNQVRANIKEPKVRSTEKGDAGSRTKPPQGVPQPRAAASNAPSGVPQPKQAQKTVEQGAVKSPQPLTGTPMPKAAVPPAAKAAPEAVKQVEEAGKAEVVKKQVPVKSEQSPSGEKPVKQAAVSSPSQPAAKATAEKTAPKATVEDNVRRPNLPRGPVIVKRAEEVAAEDAARKAASEKAAQARKEQQQAAAASGARRQSSDNRGPRQSRDGQGQGQGSRDNRDNRGPRQNNDNRGPRPAGDNRGPRPAGDNRGPRPGGDNRGSRPGSDDNRSRPQGDRPQRPKTSSGGDDVATKPTRKNDGKKSVKKDRPDNKGNKIEKKERGKGLMEKKFIERPAPKKRPKKVEKVVEPEIDTTELPAGTKIINVPITVAGLAEQIEKTSSEIIVALMKLGIMANINQNVDEDTAILLGAELGVNIVVDKVQEEEVEEGLELYEDKEEDMTSRPPIITVMGHVDHGKTSLLDTIRKTSVTDSEAGGITQHIGASEAYIHGKKIVFLDTPGHEAFTTMRARGAHVTDIAILVVAADDSVKPQTIEAISHAKAAGVPIIVAVNKIDKPGANPDRVKQDLTEHGILVEDWGGDTICVPVSAKTGEGIESLLEMVLLQAEVLELKANPNRLAMGTVIEARLDKAKGPVATLLVLNGTLKTGMSVVAGTSSGRIRAMTNYKGDSIHKAGPATAVEILGLTDVPEAGDEFNAVKEDKIAREIAESRKDKQREEVLARNSSVTLEQLFSQIQEGEIKELNLIVKGDVQGSVGAVTQSLEKLANENVRVKIIHTGVGTVTESDVLLASTSGAIIIGFNVRPSTVITNMAERENVEIRSYRIIYEIIDDVEAAMKGMLDPIFKEVVMGKVEIRETFKVPNIGIIGGAYVLEGKVQRNAQVRLVRDGIIIHEGKISSLKRFKDDVKEVASNYECGIGIENYNDIKEGDIIEAFMMEEIERK